jgi:hypothetical protein
MSRARFAILILVTLNAGLCFVLIKQRATHKPEPAAAIAEPAPKTPPPKTTAASVIIRTNAFNWGQLESEDYRTYIARLRSIGCPEETIRDIVIADFEKLMAPKIRAVDGPRERPVYWKAERKDLASTLGSLEKLSEKQNIDFEKRQVIQELLGVDLAEEHAKTEGEQDIYEERLGFLPADKRMRVRMAIEQANQDEVYLREKSWLANDALTEDERKQLAEIQKTKENTIASILSPEELKNYNLWFSPSAYRVREALSSLNPTEDKFLGVYQIQQQFDEKWDGVDPAQLSPQEQINYNQAKQDYEDHLREFLGAGEYEKFQRAQDPDYQQLEQAAAQFSLQGKVASDVYGFKKTLDQERNRVIENTGLSAEEKIKVLHDLSAATETAVTQAMGEKAYRYYRRTGGGKWIGVK